MSNEVYNLGIYLTYKDNASKGIASTISQLQTFRKEAKSFISVYEKLQKTVSKEISPKIKTPKLDNQDNFVPKKAKDELDKITGKTEKQYNLVSKLANLNEKVFEPSRQIADTWKRQIESLEKYTDESKKLYLAQSKFKLINLSPEENKKAFDAVTESVRKMGITTRAEGIETLTDLHTAFGNLEHAIETLPLASKYRFSMETLFGDKFSSSQIEQQIQSAAKYLEVTGKVAQGREEMERSFNVMTQIANATGGRVTPSEMLLMGRRAGSSARNLSTEGLRNLSAVIQEMGGDGTGTSLMSLSQALVGGVMKQSAAAEFDRLGLIDRSKIEYGKAQKIKKLLPGANKLGDLVMEDPLKAADVLREAMKKGGINTEDPKEITKELMVLFGNRKAQNLMDILMNQRSQVVKEADLSKNAQNIDQMFGGMDNNLKNLQMAEKAWSDFKAELGKPLIEIGSGLAKSLLPIMKFFGDHPTLTQWTMAALLAGKALKGIAETSSILKSSGMLSYFSQSTTQVQGLTTSVVSAEKKVGGLKNTVSSLRGANIPVGVQIASVVGIDLLLRVIEWEIQKALDAKKSFDAAADASKTNYSVFQNAEKGGLKYTQKDFQTEANLAWSSVMNLGLKQTLPSEIKKQPFFSFSGNSMLNQAALDTFLYPLNSNKFQGGFLSKRQLNPDAYASGFKNTAGILGDSRVMIEFLKQLNSRVPNKTEQKPVLEGLQKAFPDSFAAAMKELSNAGIWAQNLVESQKQTMQLFGQSQVDFQNLLKPTVSSMTEFQGVLPTTTDNISKMSEASGKAITPLGNILNSANRANTGLNSVGDQFAAFKLQTPTFQTIQVPPILNTPISSNTQSNQSPFNSILPPPKASGGRVLSDGLVYVHKDEDILPANVTSKYEGGLRNLKSNGNVSNQPNRNGSNPPIIINYNPQITINGADKDSEKRFAEQLSKHSEQLERIITKRMQNGRVRS